MVQVKNVVVAYVSILQHLIQHSVTMETLQFDKEPAKERNQSEEENDANLNFMEIILTHPIIFEWFLLSSDSKTTLKIVLIDDEKKTTVCGKALLQIMESQVPSKETFQQLVQMMQLAGCHDIDVILLRLLKDNLTYVVYTTMETLQYCLDNPSKIRIEISKVLVTHSIAHQLQFEEWCQRKRNLKLLSNNKSVYLPVISVYLKKFKLVANGVQSKNALESLRCALLPWLLEGRDNEVEESLQFSVWCELITGYQDIGNKYEQLICKVTEHSQTWNRYQAEGCLRMMQILHTDENDEYKMSYIKSSLQCLNLLHKDALQIQLEHFLNRSVISVAMTLSSLPSTTGFAPVWNRYVKTGLKNRYENSDFLRCLSRLLPKVYGSITIEGAVHLSTIYQMVISHSRFLATMMSKEDTNDKQTNKELLVVLLLTMAKLKPVDCCNTSHFTVLLAAYGCTLSKIDQLILQLMNIYEANNAVMWQYRPYMWGASAMEQHRKQHQFGSSLRNVLGMKDILQLLDKDKMQQTVLKFPLKRRLQLSLQDSITTDNPSIYDPCFLLPLFSHLMTPASVVGVRLFVEFHGLGLVISALSSVDSNMRAAAYLVLTDFCQHLEGAIFKEKKQFLYLMECLKNSVTEPNMRISNIITTFIGKVLQILFVPEDTMYPMVQRFLLMKPELNLQTVPQFQRLFASSDFEFKRQHEWILKICQDGLRDQLDFYICNKKCFVFKQIMSLFSSATCDKVTKIQILDIIKSAVTIRGGAVELGRYHGLLPWLHSIIITSDNDVLESVVNTVNTMWMTLSAPKLQYTKSDVDNKPQSLVSMRTIIGVFIICDAVLNKLELKIPASFLKLILQLIESVTTYQHTTYGKTPSSDRILSVMYPMTQWLPQQLRKGEILMWKSTMI
ncbi:nucleolar pre-ribosomal-associated protein 1-like, partial [Saccoglossus kowalevskii]